MSWKASCGNEFVNFESVDLLKRNLKGDCCIICELFGIPSDPTEKTAHFIKSSLVLYLCRSLFPKHSSLKNKHVYSMKNNSQITQQSPFKFRFKDRIIQNLQLISKTSFSRQYLLFQTQNNP